MIFYLSFHVPVPLQSCSSFELRGSTRLCRLIVGTVAIPASRSAVVRLNGRPELANAGNGTGTWCHTSFQRQSAQLLSNTTTFKSSAMRFG